MEMFVHTDPLMPNRSWGGLTVGVLGLGRSGRAAARLLRREGVNVLGVDDRAPSKDHDRSALEALGIELHLGSNADVSSWTSRMSALIVSPGVNPAHPLVRAVEVAGLPVISELELASRRIEAPIVAVTGTNGKSTTATLVHHMFSTAGRPAHLAGNIGVALCDEIERLKSGATVVIEASSFQLERIHHFHPRSAGILNIAPDHLDRYGGLDEYLAAKARIAENLGPKDAFVFPLEDAALVEVAVRQGGRRRGFALGPVDSPDLAAWIEGGSFVRLHQGHIEPVLSVDELPLLGVHNQRNVLAALCLVESFELSSESLAKALRTMQALPHRTTLVLQHEGVRWIDDSKATNVHAARASLEGLEGPFVLLLGGRGKGEDYRGLRDAMTKVSVALCYGEEGSAIAEAIEGTTDVVLCPGMVDALENARRIVRSGWTVLLSPACASFDEFENYEHRGRVFADWVRTHARRAS